MTAPAGTDAAAGVASARAKSFPDVLKQVVEEDYERCATVAAEVLCRRDLAASPYRPLTIYFKLFAEAYRTWQSSYAYEPIRDRFRLAHEEALRALPPGEADLDALLEGLGALSEMLAEYTRCENAVINNDPFALVTHAGAAIGIEDRAIARTGALLTRPGLDPVLRSTAEWLREYLERNRLLHTGLHACATVYRSVFVAHRVPPDAESRLDEAEARLADLQRRSPELASELRAHLAHTRAHVARLSGPAAPRTRLRVAAGRLVMTLSAGCDRDVARRVLASFREAGARGRQSVYQTELEEAYSLRHLAAERFRVAEVHDIFQTSFGEKHLGTLVFDLPRVRLTLLDDRVCDAKASIELAAFGTASVSFTVDLGAERPDAGPARSGMWVEELRAAQSAICPHAGQVAIQPSWTEDGPPLIPVRFGRRISLSSLRQWLGKLANTDGPCQADARSTLDEVDRQIHELTRSAPGGGGGRLDAWEGLPCATCGGPGLAPGQSAGLPCRLCALVRDPHLGGPDQQGPARSLREHCGRLDYLYDVAQEYIETLGQVFREWARRGAVGRDGPAGAPDPWRSALDTGWYSYVIAQAIDEVSLDDGTVRRVESFEDVARHPDALGLLVEQREARASFDDWRRMHVGPGDFVNLALVRSHRTDAFYLSEYQAFAFFPDDPKFLVDQYEQTILLVLRLHAVLRYHSRLVDNLAHRLQLLLQEADGSPQGAGDSTPRERLKQVHDLNQQVLLLRFKAREIRNLVLRAGVSRYRDHGELMARALSQTRVDAVAEVLDRQVENLDDLHQASLEYLRKRELAQRRRDSWWARVAGAAVGAVLAVGIVPDWVTAGYNMTPRQAFGVAIGLAIALISLVFAVTVWASRADDD